LKGQDASFTQETFSPTRIPQKETTIANAG